MWHHQINIKEPMDKFYDDKISAEECMAEVVKILETSKLFPKKLTSALKRCKTEEGFDRALDRVYDFADSRRIWLGI